jgi:hypothetical protein
LSLTVIALLALALSIPRNARADARSAGLAGSLLIENRDDIYFLPQLTLHYPNEIAFSYGASAGAGNGLLLFGSDGFQFGVAVHRGDVQSPMMINELAGANGPASLFGVSEATKLNGPTSVFGPPFGTAPATLVDLLFGTSTGGGDLGFRLSVGSADTTSTAAGRDTSNGDSFLMGEVGYGWGTRGQSTRMDLSGAVSLDFAGSQAAGTNTASGTHVGFSGLLRSFVPMDASLDLGVLVNAQAASISVTNEVATNTPSASVLAFNLGGGVGPAFRFGRVQVAGYGVVRVGFQHADPDSTASNDGVDAHTIVLPGVQLATEVPLNDWFYVRTGAEYAFRLIGTNLPANNSMSRRDGAFSWNAGLGAWIDQFRFDGSLQQGFVTGGPNFIGGTAGGFLAIATLSYSFDKARKEANAVHEAPPPQPTPAPAPPPEPPPPALVEPEPVPAEQPPAEGGFMQAPSSHIEGGAGASTQSAPAPEPAPAPAPSRPRHRH